VADLGQERLDEQPPAYSKAPWEINSVKAATSPWWKEPDGVLARVRGDAAVVREIISLKGL